METRERSFETSLFWFHLLKPGLFPCQISMPVAMSGPRFFPSRMEPWSVANDEYFRQPWLTCPNHPAFTGWPKIAEGKVLGKLCPGRSFASKTTWACHWRRRKRTFCQVSTASRAWEELQFLSLSSWPVSALDSTIVVLFHSFPYVGKNHPNWLTFSRRVEKHQPDYYYHGEHESLKRS